MSRTYRVTPHALQRYRERIDPAGTEAAILALLADATPAPKWVRWVAGEPSPTKEYLVGGPVLFIVAPDFSRRWWGVVTCLSMPALEGQRMRTSVKERKRFLRKRKAG